MQSKIRPPKGGRNKQTTQRQLRVAEEIRHVLADIFLREAFYQAELDGVSITVAEVTVTADLSHASVFITLLGSDNETDTAQALNRLAPLLRHLLAQRLTLRRTPRLTFHLDTRFDTASRINSLIDANNRAAAR